MKGEEPAPAVPPSVAEYAYEVIVGQPLLVELAERLDALDELHAEWMAEHGDQLADADLDEDRVRDLVAGSYLAHHLGELGPQTEAGRRRASLLGLAAMLVWRAEHL